MGNKGVWVVASLGIGILQGWDSGAFSSGALVAALAIAGILALTAAIATPVHHGVRIAALAAGAVLLVVARIVAPVSLNTLHLALFPAAVYILFVKGLNLGARHTPA
jgi:hypothetical protein